MYSSYFTCISIFGLFFFFFTPWYISKDPEEKKVKRQVVFSKLNILKTAEARLKRCSPWLWLHYLPPGNLPSADPLFSDIALHTIGMCPNKCKPKPQQFTGLGVFSSPWPLKRPRQTVALNSTLLRFMSQIFWGVCQGSFPRISQLNVTVNDIHTQHTRARTCTWTQISWARMIPLGGENNITSEDSAEILQHQRHLLWLINSGLNLLLSGKSGTLSSRHPPAIKLNVPGILTFYWFQSKAYVKKAAQSPKGILATNTLGEIQTTKNRKKDKMRIWVTQLRQPKQTAECQGQIYKWPKHPLSRTTYFRKFQ